MYKVRSIKVNAIMNVILTMSTFIFPLITFPYVSRILLPEGTGRVAFAGSVITYFSLFASLGIPSYGIRACAKVRDDEEVLRRTVQEILLINFVMMFFSYILLGIALLFSERLWQDRTLILITSSQILFNTLGVEWLYRALEQYTYITIRSIIFKFIAVVGMFALIHSKGDYLVYGGLTIFASSASSIFNFINLHRLVKLKPAGSYQFRKHIKPILIFFAMSCATTIYTNLDNVMLGVMKNNTEVGYYTAAVKIKNVLVSVVTSLGAVLLPRSSYYWEHGDKDKFFHITKKAMNFVVLLSVPLCVYFILYAREGVYFLSGDAYKGAIIPMQIIMPTVLLIGMTNVMGIQMLVPMGDEKKVLYSEIAGAAVDLVINLILIPKLNSAGAAIGTLVAELIVWIVQCLFLRTIIRDVYQQFQYWKIGLAILAGSFCCIWIKMFNLGNFLSLLFSGGIFFGVYLVVLLVVKEPFVLRLGKEVMIKVNRRS